MLRLLPSLTTRVDRRIHCNPAGKALYFRPGIPPLLEFHAGQRPHHRRSPALQGRTHPASRRHARRIERESGELRRRGAEVRKPDARPSSRADGLQPAGHQRHGSDRSGARVDSRTWMWSPSRPPKTGSMPPRALRAGREALHLQGGGYGCDGRSHPPRDRGRQPDRAAVDHAHRRRRAGGGRKLTAHAAAARRSCRCCTFRTRKSGCGSAWRKSR